MFNIKSKLFGSKSGDDFNIQDYKMYNLISKFSPLTKPKEFENIEGYSDIKEIVK